MNKKYILRLCWLCCLIVSTVTLHAVEKIRWERSSYSHELFLLPYYMADNEGVIYKAIPEPPTALAQAFCDDEATVADLTVTGEVGAVFKWYDSETAVKALDDDELLASGTYYVSQTVNGEESARTSVLVNVVHETVIGTGTSVQGYPLGNYYGYERSAALYTASELGFSGTLVSIAWDVVVAGNGNRPIKIYLEKTTSATISSTDWDTVIANATLVYDDSMEPTLGWNVFNLSSPFELGSTDNLIVFVEANYGGYGNGGGANGNSVRYSTVTNGHVYWREDNNPPTGSGTITSLRPNIRLTSNSPTCKAPEGLILEEVSKNHFKISWSASEDASVYGLILTESEESYGFCEPYILSTASTEYKFDNLTSNTEYSVWLRSDCGSDLGMSSWVGPLKVSTLCGDYTLPFWEGFNDDSETKNCWRFINNGVASGTWSNSTTKQEGTHSMYFDGGSTAGAHDNWMISPGFQVDSTKMYKLSYYYSSSSSYNNTFTIKLSNQGVAVSDFTQALGSRSHSSSDWTEDVLMIGGIDGVINIAWQVTTSNSASLLYIDNIRLEAVECAEPINLGVKDIGADNATIYWEDEFNASWQYIVQEEGEGYPDSSGTGSASVVIQEAVVTKEQGGKNLQPNTEYEFYIRAQCNDGSYGDWIGPYVFKTICTPSSLPFYESFETSSLTKECWTVIDGNKDGVSTSNRWHLYSSSSYAYEGGYSMRFYGTSGKTHDDWLVSPAIPMNGTDIYQLTYYYRTDASYDNEVGIYLSTNGVDPAEFTTLLLASDTYKNGSYQKKKVYVTGVTGTVHIGWHVTSTGASYVYLDEITIEKVGCMEPDDEVTISELESDKVTFSWEDDYNSQWEYYVQEAGAGAPVGSGTLANVKTVAVTRTSGVGGVNLQPNTEYEFYVRSTCGPGKNSKWVGPILFTTPCASFTTPFQEGFNSDSKTIDCWAIIDVNNDVNSFGDNKWRFSTTSYEGTHSAYFEGWSSPVLPHDDWLISPGIQMDATKYYRLRYHYRTSASYQNDFKVMISNSGANPSDFVTVLDAKIGDKTATWQEETLIISGIGGDVYIGWNVISPDTNTYIYVDNVFVEEVEGCPEPVKLGSKDEEENKATIYWEDNFGSGWEYVVQKKGGNAPTGSGTVSSNKQVVVTTEINGDSLEHNTEYEFYVRTDCGNGEFSEWSGPYEFRTACGVYNLPFWEGFNSRSESVYCWTILDVNGDETSTSKWRQYNYGSYEGTHTMYFYISDYNNTVASDDWLISPVLSFASGKTYRLKYHYKGSSYYEASEFEVLASTQGIKPIDFTREIVKSNTYKNDSFKEEKAFISGLSGDVNLAWHVKGVGSKEIYIDNVFVEEVIGCPEPLGLEVRDIEAKKATLSWTDDFGATAWEYYIQEAGGGLPASGGIVTTNKEVVATMDGVGAALKANTDYEFYVRTDCGNGEYSIWAGPFKFVTLCDVYVSPFWEGFNSDSKTIRCWTVVDVNDDGEPEWGEGMWSVNSWEAYEGDRSMYIEAWDWMGVIENDDWLISPTIDMTANQYVLKYHYRSDNWDNARFEVVMSSDGIVLDKFTHTLVGEKTYDNNRWQEEVAFFNGVSGSVNIAWHLTTIGSTKLVVDNVSVKEVKTCPEPYYVEVSNPTSTTMDVKWEQLGGVSSWEVLVVNYGQDATAVPVQTATVTGSTETTITGLPPGKGYYVYVRAKCVDGVTNSDWSTPGIGFTKVGANDNCIGAINIPVNQTMECIETVSGTLGGATSSPTPLPSCMYGEVKDVWFEFTATSTLHQFSLKDIVSLTEDYAPSLSVAIYEQDCGSIANTALVCYNAYSDSGRVLTDMIPGQKYYVRIGVDSYSSPDVIFNICVVTPENTPLVVSESGEEYSVEELVKDVLINSNCDLVSNISYQVGDGSPATTAFNAIGYFNKDNSIFPFDEGIVLATNEVSYVSGPFMGTQGVNRSRWIGDKDLNDAIDDAGGKPQGVTDMLVTQLEFDFFPVKDSIKFDYLFASNSYIDGCTYTCQNGSLFAAWLIDLTTGEGQNLAKIKGTQTPISLYTIWDSEKITGTSCSSYPDLFWKNYTSGISNPIEAPINFAGSTVAMSSETVHVVPGRKYHIKLAVMDFCPNHSSAVFFNAGSFDLGNLDLGADLLVETNNALCGEECVTIKSGLGADENVDVIIQWYKDGVLISGATEPNYEACESGIYRVVGKYPAINCEVEGEKVIEIYPPISEVVKSPKALEVCRYSLSERKLDLSSVEEAMFARVDKEDYETSYYLTEEEAVQGSENTIGTDYLVEGVESRGVYIRVEDLRTGCTEVFALPIHVQKGEVPTKSNNVSVCAEYVFPDLEENQYYYTESAAGGVEYKAGDVLDAPGEHAIYVLQLSGEGGCYEEVSFKVSITAAVVADVFEDVILSCELYELQPLSDYNRYFTESGGQGMELHPGMTIPLAQTIYVYAKSDDGLCEDESSFTVTYEDCPIPRGISPNGDGLNDTFDLSRHGVESIKIYNRWGTEVYSHGLGYTNQWHGQNKGDKQLPDGTYYYVIVAHGKVRTGWVQINR